MQKSQFIATCNDWASKEVPFLFLIDYELEKFHIVKLEDAERDGIFYNIHGHTNISDGASDPLKSFPFELTPIHYKDYEKAFSFVRKHIIHGNSFLLNLTFPTQITTNLSLRQIFENSNAPYKILFKDQFVVFSPETFVKIKENHIYSYPMKGTIDASIPDAEKILLSNEKEYREHITIVDLIRNDLSIVSKDVRLTKFRYIDRIKTNKNELLQVSSEISGRLTESWRTDLGNIILKLLPAGSISGAPKKKTLEIIAEAEGLKRGFFTGIFGVYKGKKLDTGVMIRYIEKTEKGLQFRSGGGITGNSNPQDEYNEMIEKYMFPLFETIAIVDGVPQHLHWHQSRLNDSFNCLFSGDKIPELRTLIEVPEAFKTGKIKCRVGYSNTGHEVVYSEYITKRITSLKIVVGDHIDYPLKFSDRGSLDFLLRMKGECDEILILKNKRITDTSYTNIVFFNGEHWVTPSEPLLKGTCRSRLLYEGKIFEAEIKVEDLNKYRSFKLINAMIGFEEVDEISVAQIKLY